jgi:hypothetical protein
MVRRFPRSGPLRVYQAESAGWTPDTSAPAVVVVGCIQAESPGWA